MHREAWAEGKCAPTVNPFQPQPKGTGPDAITVRKTVKWSLAEMHIQTKLTYPGGHSLPALLHQSLVKRQFAIPVQWLYQMLHLLPFDLILNSEVLKWLKEETQKQYGNEPPKPKAKKTTSPKWGSFMVGERSALSLKTLPTAAVTLSAWDLDRVCCFLHTIPLVWQRQAAEAGLTLRNYEVCQKWMEVERINDAEWAHQAQEDRHGQLACGCRSHLRILGFIYLTCTSFRSQETGSGRLKADTHGMGIVKDG